jgi:hypothetical protein
MLWNSYNNEKIGLGLGFRLILKYLKKSESRIRYNFKRPHDTHVNSGKLLHKKW